MNKVRRFLAVLLTFCMIFTTQTATLWASVVPQEETEAADVSLAEVEEGLVGEEKATLNEGELLEEPSVDEGIVGAVVPGTSVSLVDLKGSTGTITASANQTTGLERNAALEVTIGFTLDDAMLTDANRRAEYWSYDLSSVVGADHTILSLVDGEEGALKDGNIERGYYKVDGNVVKLYIEDREWIEDPSMNQCTGNFVMSINLNEDENATEDSATIAFPGGANLPIEFEQYSFNTSKTVGASSSGQSAKTDGGEMQVIKNADGTYTLYYTITETTNVVSDIMTISDSLTGGQKLDQGSLVFTANGSTISVSTTTDDNGFSADIAAAFTDHKVPADTTIQCTYTTTIAEKDLTKVQDNGATWTNVRGSKTDNTSVTPVYKQDLNTNKLVGLTQYNYQAYTNGQEVELTANDDGTYTILYKITATPTSAMDIFTVTDTLGAYQALDATSLKLQIGGQDATPAPTFTATDNSFSLNIADYLSAQGKAVTANTEYVITYCATASADAVGKALTNHAEWTYDVGKKENDTNITLKQKAAPIPLSKVVNAANAVPGDTLTYTITIGDGDTDLAGKEFIDNFYGIYEYVENSFSITPAVSGAEPTFTNKSNSTVTSVEMFRFKFPTDGSYKNEYTIKYSVKIPEDADSNGTQYFSNKGKLGDGDEKSAQTAVNFGEKASAEKVFGEWDPENKIAYFDVKVAVTEGATVTNFTIIEKQTYYRTDEGNNGTMNPMKVDYDNIVVTKNADQSIMSSDNYSVDSSNGTITFPTLSENVTVRIPAISAIPFDYPQYYWANNGINYKYDGGNETWKEAKEKYVASDYTMTKTGELDKSTGVVNWYVEINRSKLVLETDHVPYFTDEIPEGMELVDNKITVNASGIDSTGKSYGTDNRPTIAVTPDEDNVIGPVDLTQFGWGGSNPAGLSGLYYRIWYQTKLTEAELNKINTIKDLYSYTNSAAETTQDGTPIKTASDTIEYIYDGLVTKSDTTSTFSKSTAAYRGNQICYEIIANADKETLNDNKPIVISDTISTNVSLISNSVDVLDENGEELTDAIISYDNLTRILEIIIPDKTYAKITFKVSALQKGKQTFDNKVELVGKCKSEDSTSEDHVVTNTGGSVTLKNSIRVHKIDKYNLKNSLPGAEFKLYVQEVDEYGQFVGDPVPVNDVEENATPSVVTNNGGIGTFSNLTSGTLYRLEETKAPDGYEEVTTLYNFMYYEKGATDAETEANRQAIWELDDKISAANNVIVASLEEGTTVDFVNRKENSYKTEFKGTKTLTGRDMADNEFTIRLIAPENVPMPEGSETKTIETDEGSKTVAVKEVYVPAAEADTASEFTFGDIKFTEEGEYTYTIQEVIPEEGLEGVTYDTSEYTVTVNVATNSLTQFLEGSTTISKINPDSGESTTAENVSFSNQYIIPGPTTVNITAEKVWDDAGHESERPGTVVFNLYKKVGENEPELVEGDSRTIRDTGADEQKVAWADLPATDENKNEIIYSVQEEPIIGYVSTVSGDATSGFTVTNTYAATTYTPEVVKALAGDEAPSETFTFTLKDDTDYQGAATGHAQIATDGDKATVTGAGTATFAPITLTKAGTYQFTISEDVPADASKTVGMAYSTGEVTIEVTVEAGTDGILAVTNTVVTGGDNEAHALVNTYTKPAGSAQLRVKKEVAGDYSGDDSFVFTLAKVDSSTSDVLPESVLATAKKDQEAVFGAITYSEEGTYYYTITENEGSVEGIDYDTVAKYAKVDVKYVSGELKAESITYGNSKETATEDSLTITNTCIKTTYTPEVVKALAGDEAPSETFTFTLTDDTDYQGAETGRAQIAIGGDTAETQGASTATFAPITFTKAGTYKFTISEDVPAEGSKTAGMAYSTSEVAIEVTVEAGTDGVLAVTNTVVTGGDNDAHALVNTYTKPAGSATLSVGKKVTDNYDGDASFKFKLEKYDASTSDVLPGTTVISVKNGMTDSFGSITYSEAGEYTYVITEVVEEESMIPGMEYDTTPKYAKVKVDLVGGELKAEDPVYGEGLDSITAKSLTVENTYKVIKISKVDITSEKELKGAHLQILKGTDIVYEWDSTEAPRIITKFTTGDIETGVTYTIRETVAPGGYEVTTDKTFVLNEDGTIDTTATLNDKGVILIKDSLKEVVEIDFTLNKVEAGGSKEVEGAVITLYTKDEAGTLTSIDSWTSKTGETHDFGSKLTAGGKYILRETVAPTGYGKVTSDIAIAVAADGKITTDLNKTTDASGNVVYLVEDDAIKFTVNKTDAGTGDEVEGAVLTVIKIGEGGKETVIDSWTSKAGETHDFGSVLEAGKYYVLREETAPTGYGRVTTDIAFAVKGDGTIETELAKSTDAAGNEVYLVEDDAIKFIVNKTDIATGDEIDGAVIEVIGYDDEGNETVLDSWTSKKNETHDFGSVLDSGKSYVLREKTAPTGYGKLETDIAFTVNDDGTIDTGLATTKDESGNDVYLVEDAKTLVKVSKVDITSGAELAGAKIQIKDESGTVVAEWTSNKEVHEIEGLKAGSTYTLEETVAPTGYVLTAATSFSIDEYGKVTSSDTKIKNGVLLVEDDMTSITISKVDVADSKEVKDAVIQIIDDQSKIVETWTSDGKAHTIRGLKVGVEYTLHETVAPNGYTLTTDTTFTIDKNGKVTVTGSTTTDEDGNLIVLIEDAKTKISISKTDIVSGAELKDAKLEILDKDGNSVESWTSGEEAHVVEGLTTGVAYTLRETVAPEGYAIAADTVFTINSNGTVVSSGTVTEKGVILVEDKPLHFNVNKTLLGDEEKEIDGAVLTVFEIDEEGTETKVDSWTSKAGETHDFGEKLNAGRKYVLREETAPTGYGKLTSDIAFAVGEDGTITTELKKSFDKDGNVVYLVEDDTIKFNVNKTDAGTGDEVDGAVLTVLEIGEDGTETKVDSWTSKAGETHDFGEKLDAGKSYVLREEIAPTGYGRVTTDIAFTVKEDGTIETELAKSLDAEGNDVYVVEDDAIKFTVNKTDAGTGDEVDGAVLTVFEIGEDGTETKVDSWTSKTGETHDFGEKLTSGKKYVLREETAPVGYGRVTTDIAFTVEDDGTITTELAKTTDEAGNEIYVVEDDAIKFNVNKTDAGTGDEVAGAVLTVLEAGEGIVETVVDSWTSKVGEMHDFGDKLTAGKKYVLREETAPVGYGKITTDIAFTVEDDGTITTELAKSTDASGNEVYLVEDDAIKFNVNKTDVGTGEEIDGAVITVFGKNESGELVSLESWTSKAGETHDFGSVLTAGKKFILREETAPVGYGKVTTDVAITVAEDGTVTADLTKSKNADGEDVYLVEDNAIKFTVNKVAAGTGEELDGAKLYVFEKTSDGKAKAGTDGKALVIDSWTSKKGETHDFGSKLEAGKTYYLVELVAPTGYNVMTTVEVKVAEDGTITTSLKGSKTKDGSVVYLVEDTLKASPTPTTTTKKTTITTRPKTSTSTTTKTTTTAKTTAARTGDNSPIALYVILLLVAGAAIVVVVKRGKKAGK